MKNKIAVNAKYFKQSQVSAESGHVMRVFAENKNVIAERTKFNFGTPDSKINANYDNALKQMGGLKKNSNTLIDAVLVFPLEQWNESKLTNQQVNDSIVKIMKQFESEYGLKPLGYKMHLDEGHTDENGKFILNPHAHMLFANHCSKDISLNLTRKVTVKDPDTGKAVSDPKNPKKYLYERDDNGKIIEEKYTVNLQNKMPLQHLQGRGTGSAWSRFQDIAAEHLKAYGFERGLSKDITQAKHLTKQQHIARELSRADKQLEALNIATKAAQKQLESIQSEFKSTVDSFINERESLLQLLINDIELNLEDVEEKQNNMKSIYDIAQSEELKEKLIESSKQRIDDIKDAFKSTDALKIAQDSINQLEKSNSNQRNKLKNNYKM